MNSILSVFLSSAFLVSIYAKSGAAESGPAPTDYVFASPHGVDLKAYVFTPAGAAKKGCAAIVIFYGGGWAMGEPSWAFSRAQHFAQLGLVAVAAQYRLSDQKSITPLDAIADARAVIRWMRSEAKSLGLAPEKIVADGWSAGAHLAACTALLNDDIADRNQVSAVPNALILVSPAVSLENDRWFKKLLLGRAEVQEVSPVHHIRPSLPPTLILVGRTDTVTPLVGVQQFAELMQAAKNRCELHVYDGVGHLFTPSHLPDDGFPQPDKSVAADALARADDFLRSLHFAD